MGDAEERYLRGRIYYAIDSDTSLLPAKSIKDVEVRYRGREKPLDAPRAVTVVLRNGGRRDISRDAFDGTPFRLDIGEQIVECLDVTTAPPDQPVPQVTADGSVLAIEPVKISPRETISVELLIDGGPPMLRDPLQTLNDVEIRLDPGDRPPLLVRVVFSWWLPVSTFLTYVGLSSINHSVRHVDGWVFGGVVTMTVIAFIGAQLRWPPRRWHANWFSAPE